MQGCQCLSHYCVYIFVTGQRYCWYFLPWWARIFCILSWNCRGQHYLPVCVSGSNWTPCNWTCDPMFFEVSYIQYMLWGHTSEPAPPYWMLPNLGTNLDSPTNPHTHDASAGVRVHKSLSTKGACNHSKLFWRTGGLFERDSYVGKGATVLGGLRKLGSCNLH